MEFKICNANLKKSFINDKQKATGTVTRESRRTEIIVKSRDKKRVENNTIFFKNGIDNAEICNIIVVWGITTMNNYEFLEKLGFSSNEAKVY